MNVAKAATIDDTDENRESRTWVPGVHPTAQDLAAYRDDTLDEDGEERVRKHIESCDSCRDQFLALC
jgi:anti-sigma factor RsiW